MFRNLVDQPFALVIIVLLVVVLFGATRLPNAARQLGRSMRIFKSEVKQMKDEGKNDSSSTRPEAAAEPLEGRVVSEERAPRTDPVDEDRTTDPARNDA